MQGFQLAQVTGQLHLHENEWVAGGRSLHIRRIGGFRLYIVDNTLKQIPLAELFNGGGFVFDCRAVNNPGKYERYKPFTGLDEPVIRFLEEDGEIAVFLEHVYALVDASVKRYMERGFTSLSVCFGCTGGQHRSVYSAQHLAEHLNKKFGVQVNLMHREQNIEQTFNAKR